MPSRRFTPPNIVLGLLCAMYLITYVDRVNLATAADSIKRELQLSNTQLGVLQSAFGYPYLLFQIFGGWIGDRFGPRRTLVLCGVKEQVRIAERGLQHPRLSVRKLKLSFEHSAGRAAVRVRLSVPALSDFRRLDRRQIRAAENLKEQVRIAERGLQHAQLS